jgi:NADH dehydrogenase/NADH:ubiquinone oxidoreductase subunit G
MSMINFISAMDGGIECKSDSATVGWANTAESLAKIMVANKLAGAVYGSSTMDFADEEGFESPNGAHELWDEAIGIYNWVVNKVAS